MTEPEQLRMEDVDRITPSNDKQRLRRMHDRFGECSAACGTCSNFIRRAVGSRTYCKCLIYGDSAGAYSDWRAYWLGCGHINQPLKEDEGTVLSLYNQKSQWETILAKACSRKLGRPRKVKNP